MILGTSSTIIKVSTYIIDIFVNKEKYLLKVLTEIYWTKQLVIRHVKVSKITRMSLIRHISNFLGKNFLPPKETQ